MTQSDNIKTPLATLTSLNQVASLMLGWKTENYQEWIRGVFSYLDRSLGLNKEAISHLETLILKGIDRDLLKLLKELKNDSSENQ